MDYYWLIIGVCTLPLIILAMRKFINRMYAISKAWIFLYGVFWGMFILMYSIIMSILVIGMPPSAIDVYRGNTELQVTYRGTIPTDSIVVFKNK